MIFRLFLLFTLVPLTELFILLQLGKWMGLLPTLALVIGTGVAGAWLARREGLKAFLRLKNELYHSQLPSGAIVEAVMIFGAGLLLITPGLLTDMFGFFVLLPFGRRVLKDYLVRSFKSRFKIETIMPSPAPSETDPSHVVEATVVEE